VGHGGDFLTELIKLTEFLLVDLVELEEGLLLPVVLDEVVFFGVIVEEASLGDFDGGGGVVVFEFGVVRPVFFGIFSEEEWMEVVDEEVVDARGAPEGDGFGGVF